MHPSTLLILIVVVAGTAVVHGHPAASTPAARFWQQALPGTPMPDAIADLVQKGIYIYCAYSPAMSCCHAKLAPMQNCSSALCPILQASTTRRWCSTTLRCPASACAVPGATFARRAWRRGRASSSTRRSFVPAAPWRSPSRQRWRHPSSRTTSPRRPSRSRT